MNRLEIGRKMLFFKAFTHNGARKIVFSPFLKFQAVFSEKEYLSKNNSAFYIKKLYFLSFPAFS